MIDLVARALTTLSGYPFNLSQQPAASVPCGFTQAGPPVGFQLAGSKHDDTRVLRAAHAYMDAHPPILPDAADSRGGPKTAS